MEIVLDSDVIAGIITLVLAILSTALGGKYTLAKKKLAELTDLTKDLARALKVTSEAIEDDKVTPEEEKHIVESWRDVIEKAKELLK